MKQIQPLSIWKSGESFEASILNAYIVSDNLESSCSFSYELCEGGQGTEAMPLIKGNTLIQGNLPMNGEDYLAWDGDNNYAYSYIAEKLNLTLIETT
jgi:hypothetical protein